MLAPPSPAKLIADLDAALAQAGEDVLIHTVAAGVPDAGASARASVRGYKPDELAGDINQSDRKLVLSPTDVPTPPEEDDKVTIAGKTFNIEAVEAIRVQNVLVRIELQARG